MSVWETMGDSYFAHIPCYEMHVCAAVEVHFCISSVLILCLSKCFEIRPIYNSIDYHMQSGLICQVNLMLLGKTCIKHHSVWTSNIGLAVRDAIWRLPNATSFSVPPETCCV